MRSLLFMYFLLATLRTTSGVVSPYVIELETFHKVYNEKVFANVTLNLIELKNRKVINGAIIPRIDIDQFDLDVFALIPRKNGRTSTILNVTMNGCDAIAERLNGLRQLSQLILNYIRRHVQNVPKKCPLRKHVPLLLTNFSIDADKLPPFFPETNFSTFFSFYYRKELGYRVNVNGSVISKEKLKRRKIS